MKKSTDIKALPRYYDLDWVLKKAYSEVHKQSLFQLRVALLIGTGLLYLFIQLNEPAQDWMHEHAKLSMLLAILNLIIFVYAGITLYLKTEIGDDWFGYLLLWIPTYRKLADSRKWQLSRKFLDTKYHEIKKEIANWETRKLLAEDEMTRLAAGSDMTDRERLYRKDTTHNLTDEQTLCEYEIERLNTYLAQIEDCVSYMPDLTTIETDIENK